MMFRDLRADEVECRIGTVKDGVTLTTIYNKLSAAPKNEKEAWINKNTTYMEDGK